MLGRRPSTIATTRGAQTLATVTVCSTAIRTSASRSAPLLAFANQVTDMINQRIVVKHAAVVINILVRGLTKVLLGILVVENMHIVAVAGATAGTEVIAKFIVAAHTNIFAMVLMKPEVLDLHVMENTKLVIASLDIIGGVKLATVNPSRMEDISVVISLFNIPFLMNFFADQFIHKSGRRSRCLSRIFHSGASCLSYRRKPRALPCLFHVF